MMKKILLAAALLLVFAPVRAQVPSFSEIDGSLRISQKLKEFSAEIENIGKSVERAATMDALNNAEKLLKGNEARYKVYSETHTIEISAHEGLMNLVVDYQDASQALTDSITVKKARIGAADTFREARRVVCGQDSTYRSMYKMSVKLSMTQQTAKALEKLKAKEQLKFNEIQKCYNDACTAAALVPALADSLEIIDDKFIEIQSYSSKIQQATYKPFIDRIKDYLMSIASVTIILMFIMMIQGRISAAKKMKEQMKKMQEQYNKKDDIPSI